MEGEGETLLSSAMALRRIDVHRAVERGDIAVLKRYLDAGGDVEKRDEEYGAAPVHWAALVMGFFYFYRWCR